MIPSGRLKELTRQLPLGVNLLAVSKGQPSSAIRALVLEGQYAFGESKLQEALPKIFHLKDLKEIKWHFIGKVQANKVRMIVKEFNFIHSVDSLKLAERISRISVEENKTPSIMLQVKFRPDPNKSGFLENELLEVWRELNSLPNIKVLGLMTITPFHLALNERKIVFRECRNLANKLHLKDCSMGMSGDWKEALIEGSTWLRIGSDLFGQRQN